MCSINLIRHAQYTLAFSLNHRVAIPWSCVCLYGHYNMLEVSKMTNIGGHWIGPWSIFSKFRHLNKTNKKNYKFELGIFSLFGSALFQSQSFHKLKKKIHKYIYIYTYWHSFYHFRIFSSNICTSSQKGKEIVLVKLSCPLFWFNCLKGYVAHECIHT